MGAEPQEPQSISLETGPLTLYLKPTTTKAALYLVGQLLSEGEPEEAPDEHEIENSLEIKMKVQEGSSGNKFIQSPGETGTFQMPPDADKKDNMLGKLALSFPKLEENIGLKSCDVRVDQPGRTLINLGVDACVLCEVERNGYMVKVRVRSIIEIQNNTDADFNIFFKDGDEGDEGPFGIDGDVEDFIIKAGETKGIPCRFTAPVDLDAAEGNVPHQLRFEPIQSWDGGKVWKPRSELFTCTGVGDDYNFLDEDREGLWKPLEALLEDEGQFAIRDDDKKFADDGDMIYGTCDRLNFLVRTTQEREKTERLIKWEISSPLEVQNLLLHDVDYEMRSAKGYTKDRPQYDIHGKIGPGQIGQVLACNPKGDDEMRLTFGKGDVDGWSEWFRLPDYENIQVDEHVKVPWEQSEGGELMVRVQMKKLSSGTVRITLYVKYFVVNLSGMEMYMKGVDATAKPVHLDEQLCDPMPGDTFREEIGKYIMFGPIDNKAALRIGDGSDPTHTGWSSEKVKLDQLGRETCLEMLAKGFEEQVEPGQENVPPKDQKLVQWLYNVAVQVKNASGPHYGRTKIVTIFSRFNIANYTAFQLSYRQVSPVEIRNEEGEVITTEMQKLKSAPIDSLHAFDGSLSTTEFTKRNDMVKQFKFALEGSGDKNNKDLRFLQITMDEQIDDNTEWSPAFKIDTTGPTMLKVRHPNPSVENGVELLFVMMEVRKVGGAALAITFSPMREDQAPVQLYNDTGFYIRYKQQSDIPDTLFAVDVSEQSFDRHWGIVPPLSRIPYAFGDNRKTDVARAAVAAAAETATGGIASNLVKRFDKVMTVEYLTKQQYMKLKEIYKRHKKTDIAKEEYSEADILALQKDLHELEAGFVQVPVELERKALAGSTINVVGQLGHADCHGTHLSVLLYPEGASKVLRIVEAPKWDKFYDFILNITGDDIRVATEERDKKTFFHAEEYHTSSWNQPARRYRTQ